MRYWLALTLAVILGFGLLAWRGARPQAVSYEAAMRRQDRLVAAAPEAVRADYQRAAAAADAGDYEGALDGFRRAADQLPGCALLHHNLGVAYLGVERPQEAFAAFQQAVRLEPALADAWVQLAAIWAGGRDYLAAEEALSRALRLDPASEAALLLQSHVALLRGDLPRAEQIARQVADTRPDSFKAQMALGDVLAQGGGKDRLAAALQRFETALRLSNSRTDPSGFAYRRYADVALRLGRADDALQALKKAVALDPLDPTSWYLLSQAHRATGNAAAAARAAARATEVRQWAHEVKVLTDRVAQSPGDASLYFRLGAVEARRGRIRAAVSAYHAGLARNPDDRRARGELSRLAGRLEGRS